MKTQWPGIVLVGSLLVLIAACAGWLASRPAQDKAESLDWPEIRVSIEGDLVLYSMTLDTPSDLARVDEILWKTMLAATVNLPQHRVMVSVKDANGIAIDYGVYKGSLLYTPEDGLIQPFDDWLESTLR